MRDSDRALKQICNTGEKIILRKTLKPNGYVYFTGGNVTIPTLYTQHRANRTRADGSKINFRLYCTSFLVKSTDESLKTRHPDSAHAIRAKVSRGGGRADDRDKTTPRARNEIRCRHDGRASKNGTEVPRFYSTTETERAQNRFFTRPTIGRMQCQQLR